MGTTTHSALKFCFALVSVPLPMPVVDVQTATQLVAWTALTATLMVLWNAWRSLDLRALRQLSVASALGIRLGMLSLTLPQLPTVT